MPGPGEVVLVQEHSADGRGSGCGLPTRVPGTGGPRLEPHELHRGLLLAIRGFAISQVTHVYH